eukprot:1379014-Pyramimonas_sp.AAC.1
MFASPRPHTHTRKLCNIRVPASINHNKLPQIRASEAINPRKLMLALAGSLDIASRQRPDIPTQLWQVPF